MNQIRKQLEKIEEDDEMGHHKFHARKKS